MLLPLQNAKSYDSLAPSNQLTVKNSVSLLEMVSQKPNDEQSGK